MATLKNTTIAGTGAIQLPVGTTAQRPAIPSSGQMRYNSTFKVVEIYDGTRWRFMPDIVRDGLVLYLDAGEPSSYPGSGTTWTDLSGLGNNGTLVNGPTYGSSNGGTLIFDGINDYVTNGSTNFSIANNLFADTNGSWTVSAWFKFPVSPTGVRDNSINGGNCSFSIVGRSGGIATGATFTLFVGGSTTVYGSFQNKIVANLRGVNTAISNTLVNTDTWNNVVITWNKVIAYGYLNNSAPTILSPGTAGIQTFELNVGTTVSDGGGVHNFQGSISNVQIYNKSLTSQEVHRNYLATKSRFGL